MPIVGFVDSMGQRLKWEQIMAGEGVFTNDKGQTIPYPIVATCCKGYREADHYGEERAVSVTTIIAPPQQKILEMRHDLYVRPLANLWAVFGTIGHGMFEQHVPPRAIAERRLVVDFEGMLIGGTFDLLEPIGQHPGEPVTYNGWDYKVASGYGVKKMVAEGVYAGHEEYFWQGNIYAWMATRPGTKQLVDGAFVPWEPVKIEKWHICAVVRDYSKRMMQTIEPIEIIEVPLIAAERVENYLRQRITVWKGATMCDDGGLPVCTPAETWGGRRCLDYCASAPVCHQLNPGLDEGEYV